MRLITEIVSKMIMDLSRSQKVTYTVNVAISGKRCQIESLLLKGKVLPYSLPSVGPGADPGVQAVSPHVISHPLAVGCHYFPPGLRSIFISIHQMAPPLK